MKSEEIVLRRFDCMETMEAGKKSKSMYVSKVQGGEEG